MKINLICVEDTLISLGARKMAAQLRRLNSDTNLYFISLSNFRSVKEALFPSDPKELDAQTEARPMAQPLADADIVAFSSMTAGAAQVKEIIREVRRHNPNAYIIWGGVHPIIVPEDAIEHADAICTGEGEFAFAEFLDSFKNGRDYTKTRNFWFNHRGTIIKNDFLPLMSSEEMDTLPIPTYGQNEFLYRPNKKRYELLTLDDYLRFTGLTYNTIWTIGCPFKCTYCGNTKFIDNDRKYTRLRFPSPDWIVNEIRAARRIHPHISNIVFHDDSFMALPTTKMLEFAEIYKRDVGLPFCVVGVIPSYVRADKVEILLDAGMNRARMGIQSGSQRILDFYGRPGSPEKILKSVDILVRYSKYMIPPPFDMIVDNPIETRQDVIDTLELVYRMRRPFTLNMFSLRVQPNTILATQFEKLGVKVQGIEGSYQILTPTFANCLLVLLTCVRIPRSLMDRLLKRVKPMNEKQPLYPKLYVVLRFLYLAKRALGHLRFMDFTLVPGHTAWWLWRLGVVKAWNRFGLRKFKREVEPKPTRPRHTKPVSIPLSVIGKGQGATTNHAPMPSS